MEEIIDAVSTVAWEDSLNENQLTEEIKLLLADCYNAKFLSTENKILMLLKSGKVFSLTVKQIE